MCGITSRRKSSGGDQMLRLFSLVLAVCLTITGAVLPAGPALAQAGKGSLTVPVTGMVGPTAQSQVPFTGAFTIARFERSATGGVDAVGTLVASLPTGPVVVPQARMPVQTANTSTTAISAAPTQTCDILNLVLGPLHLDLLGLVVDLNQVILNITAEQGAGNLLGNLLCAITNLLNGTGSGSSTGVVGQLVQSLNGLLASLGL